MEESGLDQPPPKEELPSYQSLIWPVHEEEVITALEAARNNPQMLYRNATSELRPDTPNPSFSFDAEGRPRLNGAVIPSHAFAVGGWRHVQRVARDLDYGLLNMFDESQFEPGKEAPIMFVSHSPIVARGIRLGPDMEMDDILMVFNPGMDRARFNLPSLTRANTGAILRLDRDFRRAVRDQQPFMIQNVVEPTPGGDTYEEALIGPFISAQELTTLIRVQRQSDQGFTKLVTSMFGEI